MNMFWQGIVGVMLLCNVLFSNRTLSMAKHTATSIQAPSGTRIPAYLAPHIQYLSPDQSLGASSPHNMTPWGTEDTRVEVLWNVTTVNAGSPQPRIDGGSVVTAVTTGLLTQTHA